MTSVDTRLEQLGVQMPRVMLPSDSVDLHKWAVIACDQHTSEPDYWEEVEETVGESPSTLSLILPEVYLNAPDVAERISGIHGQMRRYVDESILIEQEPGFILTVRRTPHASERRGLLVALDLEQYDFTPGATPLIRATEQTILERIPPRVRVRRSAPLELPHVLVLVDDEEELLFGGLDSGDLPRLYETELMLGGGRVSGHRVAGDGAAHVADALEAILAKAKGSKPFLFAVGDGNHSLATAKVVWDEMKRDVAAEHPARYAMVEVVNLYDPGLRFEPIHRLVRTGDPMRWIEKLASSVGGTVTPEPLDVVRRALTHDGNTVGYTTTEGSGVIRIDAGKVLPVVAVQEQINADPDLDVDYIHGWDTSVQLGGRDDAIAVLLPEFDPRLLYPTVRRRGVMPRKSFSLGEAEEKRYYLEARRISSE